jgi:hypothetical protein
MSSHKLTETVSRSVLGTINDFAYVAATEGTRPNAVDSLTGWAFC